MKKLTPLILGACLTFSTNLHADDYVWYGLGDNNLWSNTSNISPHLTLASTNIDLIFQDRGSYLTSYNDFTNITLRSLFFDADTPAMTLSGNSLYLTHGIINHSNNIQTLSFGGHGIVIQRDQIFDNGTSENSGLKITGDITIAGISPSGSRAKTVYLTFSGAETTTVTGNINTPFRWEGQFVDLTGTVVMNGTGVLILEGTNSTFNGGLEIHRGETHIKHTGAVANTLAISIYNGGILYIHEGVVITTPTTLYKADDHPKSGHLVNAGQLTTTIGSPVHIEHDNAQILNTGEINGTSDRANALSISSLANGTIVDNDGGTISTFGRSGIHTYGAPNLTITNQNGGIIEGNLSGINVQGNSQDTVITNQTGGIIRGTGASSIGINVLTSWTGFTISNLLNATISGSEYAVYFADSRGSLINHGMIEGDVYFEDSRHAPRLILGHTGVIDGDVSLLPVNSVLELGGNTDQSLSNAITGTIDFNGLLEKTGESTWSIDKAVTGNSVEVLNGVLSISPDVLSATSVLAKNGGRLHLDTNVDANVIITTDGHLTYSNGLDARTFQLEQGGNLYLDLTETIDTQDDWRISSGGLIHLPSAASLNEGDSILIGTSAYPARIRTPFFISTHPGLTFKLRSEATMSGTAIYLDASFASELYWNGNHTIPTGIVEGGIGIWDINSQNWTTSDGTHATIWSSTVEKAIFAGTSGTVTLSNPLAISSLEFREDYQIQTSNGSSLTLGATQLESSITVLENATATLNVALAGNQTLSKTGEGTLILSHANTFTGGLAIEEGTVEIAHSNALGNMNPTAGVHVGNGTLRLNAGIVHDFNQRELSIESGTAVNKGTLTGVSQLNLREDGLFQNVEGGDVDQTLEIYGTTGTIHNINSELGLVKIVPIGAIGFELTLINEGATAQWNDGLEVASDTAKATLRNLNGAAIAGKLHLYNGSVYNEGTIDLSPDGLRFEGETSNSLTNLGKIEGNISLASNTAIVTLQTGSQIIGDLTFTDSQQTTLYLTGSGSESYSNVLTGGLFLTGSLEVTDGGQWHLDRDLGIMERVSINGASASLSATIQSQVNISDGTLTLTQGGSIENNVTLSNANSALLHETGIASSEISGNLFLSSLSTLGVQLYSNGMASYAIGGHLNLGDRVVFDLGQIAAAPDQTYLLATYEGALTTGDENLYFFKAADGGYDYVLDLATPGAVYLNVTYTGLQYWNGARTSPDGIVSGGSGTWDTSSTNWTNASGVNTETWKGLTAVFGGLAGGTVQLNETMQAEGLRFETDQYRITGPGSINFGAETGQIHVSNTVTGELAIALSGTDGWTKSGAGTLSLTAANTATGLVTVEEGRVIARHVDALPVNIASESWLTITGQQSILEIAGGIEITRDAPIIRINDGGTLLNSGTLTTRAPLSTQTQILSNEGGTFINEGTLGGAEVYLTNQEGHFTIVNKGLIDTDITLSGDGLTTLHLFGNSQLLGDITNTGTQNLNLVLDGNISDRLSEALSDTSSTFQELTKTGASAWTIDSNQPVMQNIAVNAGTLYIDQTVGHHTGATTVAAGASLGGSGNLSGQTTILSGGTLLAHTLHGAANQFTIANLTLESGATATFTLNTPSALPYFLIGESLSISEGSFVSISAGLDFGEGDYALFGLGTSQSHPDTPLLQTAPAGYSYAFDIVNGALTLVVGDRGLQFWNGAVTEPDREITGGSGIWDDTSRNWTNRTGNLSQAWNGESAVFSGPSGGDVMVRSQHQVDDLHFTTDGYRLMAEDASSLLVLGKNEANLLIDTNISAEIAVSLDANDLIVIGGGELTLSGINSFTGGVEVRSGYLTLSNDQAINGPTALFGLILNGSDAYGTISLGTTISRAVELRDNATLTVDGNIETSAASVVLNGNSTANGNIINRGTITSLTHIGIDKIGPGLTHIENHGTIAGLTAAIRTIDGTLDLIHRGTITGDVLLHQGAHLVSLDIGSQIDGDFDFYNDANARLNLIGTSGSQRFSQALSGELTHNPGLQVWKQDEGTWILDQWSSHHFAEFTIQAGTLSLENSNVNGQFTVLEGGTLAGTGEITSDVVVHAGGRLATTEMGMGTLTLEAGSMTSFTLGDGSAVIANVTDLTLKNGAYLELTGTHFNENTPYRLFNYTGSFTPSPLAPLYVGAPAGHNLVIDTTTQGQINLIANYEGLQFWNGSHTVADGTIHGGSGIWDTDTTNWTNQSGNANSVWAGEVAVFSGTTGGTVELGTSRSITGLQFGTDGYTLTGNGVLVLGQSATEFRVDPNVTATVDLRMTGSGGLTKTGNGTLSLTHANDYTGDTVLYAGTLHQGVAGAISQGTALTIYGGTLQMGAHDATISSLTGASGTIDTGTARLIFNQNVASLFSGTITGQGGLVKEGSGALELTGSLAHHGDTVVRSGSLATGNLIHSTLKLEGGSYSPGGNVAQSVTVNGLSLDGGEFIFQIGLTGSSDHLQVADGNARLLSSTHFTFDLGGATLGAGLYPLITGLAADWDLNLLSFSGLVASESRLILGGDGNTLYLSLYDGEPISGPILQNSIPVGTPTTAHFVVDGQAQTGAADESNTVRTLTFKPGSALKVFNQLTVTDGLFHIANGVASLFGGTVTTPGDFTKTGAGTLNFSSDAEVAGVAHLREGGFDLNGRFVANGGFQTHEGTHLGGSGTLVGNLTNRGRLNPGNSPGTFTVVGDFVQPAVGVLTVEHDGGDHHDRLVVTGHAALGGTLTAYGPGLKLGEKFTFLHASTIDGSFDRILLPSGLRGRFLNQGHKGKLLVAPESYTQLAGNSNHHEVATALDGFIPARGNDRAKVSLALDHLADDEYREAFHAIAPTFFESLGVIRTELAFNHLQQISQRLTAGSGAIASATGIEPTLTYDRDGSPVFTPVSNHRWGLWVDGNGLFAKSPGISQLPSYRYESGGVTVGAEYQWSREFSTGLFAGYQATRSGSWVGGKTRIDSALFGGYATYRNGGFHGNAIVGGGVDSYDLRRSIRFGEIDRTARSRPDGALLNTGINLGYDWQIGAFTLGPIASLQYSQTHIDSLTESGADSLDLRLGPQRVHSLRSVVGARITADWTPSATVTIRPELRASWQHEYLNNSRQLNAALDSGAAGEFTYTTSGPTSRDRLMLGAGASASFGNRWNASIFYNATIGQDEELINSINGGVSWKF